jgi:transposase-like protein
MSTRDIQAHLRKLYGVEISPELVSAVTDAVLDEVSAWQSRPLESAYDIVIAVVDGLKGFPEAIGTAFPEALVQTSIVHVIRYSMQFGLVEGTQRAIAAALKPIYGAPNRPLLPRTGWKNSMLARGSRYPAIAQSWRSNWEQVIPFFAFPGAVRRIIVTQSTAPDQFIAGQRGV